MWRGQHFLFVFCLGRERFLKKTKIQKSIKQTKNTKKVFFVLFRLRTIFRKKQKHCPPPICERPLIIFGIKMGVACHALLGGPACTTKFSKIFSTKALDKDRAALISKAKWWSRKLPIIRVRIEMGVNS